MNYEEAVERLRKASLYVRPLDRNTILGGTHIEEIGTIRTVQNGFIILAEADRYRVKTLQDGQGEGVGGLTLDEAVQRVIETIPAAV